MGCTVAVLPVIEHAGKMKEGPKGLAAPHLSSVLMSLSEPSFLLDLNWTHDGVNILSSASNLR
jgi:hypothetical protein